VVDYDTATTDVVRRELANAGFAAVTARTGVEGMIAIRRRLPTLVFVALQLHDVRGEEFVGWLRANAALKSVPIIAIQALGESGFDTEARKFAAVLKKPVSTTAIRNALTTALAAQFC